MQTIEHFSSYEPVDLGSHPTRDDGRVDLDGKVTLHYADLGSSVVERTQNVSVTGMFVRTSSLRPAGTILRFALDLGNGLEPIDGRAEVVWVRREGDGLFRPAGMGVRFIGLDAENQKMIGWSVEHRMRELRKILDLDAATVPSGEPRESGRSDLDDLRIELEEALGGDLVAEDFQSEKPESPGLLELRAEADVALQQGLDSSSDSSVQAPDETATAESVSVQDSEDQASVGRRLWRFASAIPLIPAVALCLYFLSPTPEPVSATPQVVETVVLAPSSTEPAPLVREVAQAVEHRTVEDAVEQLIVTWTESWSQQRARSFLALYSPDFQPPNALDRKTWETMREERILKPRQIQVEVRDVETEVLSAERARVSLTQVYSSDRYQDTVRKSFDLVHGDQGWKILAERVETKL